MDIVHSWAGGVHAAAAVLALIFGAQVLMRRKGDARHRRTGWLYALAMTVMLVAGVPMAEDGITVFHGLSVVSAVSLVLGIGAAMRSRAVKRPEARRGLLFAHYKFMAWSYAGLVAAGMAQISSRFAVMAGGWNVFWWGVAAGTALVTLIAAVWIRRFERTLAAVYRIHP